MAVHLPKGAELKSSLREIGKAGLIEESEPEARGESFKATEGDLASFKLVTLP